MKHFRLEQATKKSWWRLGKKEKQTFAITATLGRWMFVLSCQKGLSELTGKRKRFSRESKPEIGYFHNNMTQRTFLYWCCKANRETSLTTPDSRESYNEPSIFLSKLSEKSRESSRAFNIPICCNVRRYKLLQIHQSHSLSLLWHFFCFFSSPLLKVLNRDGNLWRGLRLLRRDRLVRWHTMAQFVQFYWTICSREADNLRQEQLRLFKSSCGRWPT